MLKKIDWNFNKSGFKNNTHCCHTYPAMMVPDIAKNLINIYGKGSKLLFDPYCGAGTSLVESMVNGIYSIGTDLNPLAGLIARTKTSRLNINLLNEYVDKFIIFINSNHNKIKIKIPNFKNIDYWFSDDVIYKLAIIQYFINKVKDNKIKDFFNVAFSYTIRNSSWTRKNEFKLYRMIKDKIDNFKPSVFNLMLNKLILNRRGFLSFYEIIKDNKVTSKIYDFNTVYGIPKIKKNSIDLIVTSPPYGDSKTTVAYGQFSRLSNQWLGIENANQIDNILMGGRKNEKIKKFNNDIVDDIIETIKNKDYKRAEEVYNFYFDYYKSIRNISTVVKNGGYVCYVVGNRKVKDVIIPMDEITQSFFKKFGFSYTETIIRDIINKRMPSVNSPDNVKGKVNNTMNKEYVVILKKESLI